MGAWDTDASRVPVFLFCLYYNRRPPSWTNSTITQKMTNRGLETHLRLESQVFSFITRFSPTTSITKVFAGHVCFSSPLSKIFLLLLFNLLNNFFTRVHIRMTNETTAFLVPLGTSFFMFYLYSANLFILIDYVNEWWMNRKQQKQER
jgi:hypothetical protein